MTEVAIFAPDRTDGAVSTAEFFAELDRARGELVLPFDPRRMALVAKVGDAILRGAGRFESPAVTHFAFWIRAGALRKMAEAFERRLPSAALARPRGLVFHLPPQNVETVFLYSWVISYLVGNANVVRLPQQVSADMRAICDMFLAELGEDASPTQFFVHYPSRSTVSVEISARSDVRVVWGGDAKVQAFAEVPLRRGGKSVWFGDRFSFSVMNGTAVAALDPDARQALARKLYNDVFIFDQMACSSPHILYVVGDPDRDRPGLQDLLTSLALVARQKGAQPATGHVIRKMVESFATAAAGEASAISWRDAELTTVFATQPARREQRVGGGFLRVHFVAHLADVIPHIREHDQTATYFGFDRTEIEPLARASATAGVSRWTAVGSALDFDYIWDGYDLPCELTSLVRVS